MSIGKTEKINRIISLLQLEFPSEYPKEDKADPLDMLIATILSQNTTDKTSYIAYSNLKKNFKDWDAVLKASSAKVIKNIRVCGLAKQKTATIKSLLKQLKKAYGKLSLKFIRKLSDDKIYELLLPYKGVGTKTITCVLAFGLGRDVFPVDTHVHRVTNRLGLVNTKSPDKTFSAIKDLIPSGKKYLFHTMLIRFGRKICRSARPLCGKCILYEECSYPEKEELAELTYDSAVPKPNNFIVLEHI